jgi:hypothetical protein
MYVGIPIRCVSFYEDVIWDRYLHIIRLGVCRRTQMDARLALPVLFTQQTTRHVRTVGDWI